MPVRGVHGLIDFPLVGLRDFNSRVPGEKGALKTRFKTLTLLVAMANATFEFMRANVQYSTGLLSPITREP